MKEKDYNATIVYSNGLSHHINNLKAYNKRHAYEKALDSSETGYGSESVLSITIIEVVRVDY